tara:strand:+ start:886 stop:1809 length:924 start_codon:yes stop_codon:yes gene_type:complete
MIKKITIKDFEDAIGEKLTANLKSKILECDFSYEELETSERDYLISDIIKFLLDDFVIRAGEHRAKDWDQGWSENYTEFSTTGTLESLVPKYFGKYKYVRWQSEWIKPVSQDFEYNMARVLQYWLFEKFFKNSDYVYEFGCGTGHNLLRVKEINSHAELCGLDWATSSQDSITEINEKLGTNISSKNFNFFDFDKSYQLQQNSGVYTFAALEQIGDKYHDFVNFLVNNQPGVCLHVEPMGEFLEEQNLCDFLSIKYFEKRNYLNGFMKHLEQLESNGKIEIIYKKKSFIGSLYINGYSIVAWRIKNA